MKVKTVKQSAQTIDKIRDIIDSNPDVDASILLDSTMMIEYLRSIGIRNKGFTITGSAGSEFHKEDQEPEEIFS